MHLQPLFKSAEYFPHEPGRDVAADLFNRGLCLPSGSNMTVESQQRTIDAMVRVLAA